MRVKWVNCIQLRETWTSHVGAHEVYANRAFSLSPDQRHLTTLLLLLQSNTTMTWSNPNHHLAGHYNYVSSVTTFAIIRDYPRLSVKREREKKMYTYIHVFMCKHVRPSLRKLDGSTGRIARFFFVARNWSRLSPSGTRVFADHFSPPAAV